MFKGLSSLESLDLRSFNTKTCTGFTGIFEDCNNFTIKINKENNEKLISYIPENMHIEYEPENI